MTDAPLPDLVLYGRPDCSLCDETRALLRLLLDERRHKGQAVPTIVELDVEADPALEAAYGARVPVVELGDRRLELVTSAARLRRLLAEVLDAEPARA
jgi:hypothetical protein